jgi:hypothetical protein
MAKQPKSKVPKRTDAPAPPPRENALERDPRFAKFQQLYVELEGNGYQAALRAGYGQQYAKSKSYVLVARLKLRCEPVLRRFGLDEVFVARKLVALSQAKEPRWNPRKLVQAAVPEVKDESGKVIQAAQPEVRGDWDLFESPRVQHDAIELVSDLLSMRPPTRLKGDGPGGALQVFIKTSIGRPTR